MKASRRALASLGVVVLAAACGASPQAAPPAPSSATVAPTSTQAPPPSSDPAAGDVALIKALLRAQNDAWKVSPTAGLDFYAAHSYPPGQVTRANLLCYVTRTANKASGRSFTPDEVLADMERVSYREQEIPRDGSIEPQPDYVLPAEGTFGGGGTVPGRVYVLTVDESTSANDPSYKTGTGPVELHATVIDGAAWLFPYVC